MELCQTQNPEILFSEGEYFFPNPISQYILPGSYFLSLLFFLRLGTMGNKCEFIRPSITNGNSLASGRSTSIIDGSSIFVTHFDFVMRRVGKFQQKHLWRCKQQRCCTVTNRFGFLVLVISLSKHKWRFYILAGALMQHFLEGSGILSVIQMRKFVFVTVLI